MELRSLQPALARHHYVDARSWTHERDTVLARSWLCVGRVAELGLTHGFKFAPWFGATLADLIQHGGTEREIAAFAADRKALSGPADRRWLQ